MKTRTLLLSSLLIIAGCNNDPKPSSQSGSGQDTVSAAEITEAQVDYAADSTTAQSFVAYDKAQSGPRPVILVIPEWWGLTDYVKMRVRELAKLGYLAMAVDMYGKQRTGTTPDEAGKLAMPFYSDTALVRSRLTAALEKIQTYPQADKDKIAMIGYCFGGSMSLTGAKLGLPLKGVVSFHGGLKGTANKNAPILICHGEADKMVSAEEVAAWRKSMDSLGADYTFKSYAGATHAFTNPAATATGKKFSMPIEYNAAADTASWQEMKQFFGRIFPKQ